VWQRAWLQGEVLETELDYWRQQLRGAPSVLELPTDRPRPPVPTFCGAAEPLHVSQPLTAGLKELSRQEGVTLFMTLLAAWQALLCRYTGQEDILIGSPIANRNRVETEGLIGFFVNTLVLRTGLSGNPSFRECLGRVREVCLGAYAHQDVPFEQLVEALQVERDLSHTPLFQVVLALQNAPLPAVELPGLSLGLVEMSSGTAKFDLTLSLMETEAGLVGSLEYNTDVFEAGTVRQLLGHLERLLEQIVSDPAQRMWDVPLLTDAERQQALVQWNDTRTVYPRDQSLPQLFAAQAERRPDAVAVVYESEHLTYRELNQRANQLAHELQSRGVGPERRVGLCVERSLEMIIGLVGIVKAGGAYVPLDPRYPAERLAFMLEDAQVPVLLTQSDLVARLPEHHAHIVCLDQWEIRNLQSAIRNPESGVGPDNLAYVMYTSGSTGTPKGISIPQRAIHRLVFNTNYVDLTSEDRIAQASNASFDAATFEIWGALLHGARLVGITKEVALSPLDFAAGLRDEGISVLFLTTALFNQLAREVPWAFRGVRHLLFGGEAVDPQWVKEVLAHSGPERLLHVYGPTESTTFASWHLVQDVPEGASTVPIGRPIANTEMYLLDAYLQPVPVGVAGELYIGGDGLARDYFNRPELTAEKFVPNPYRAGARLYRTGDSARYGRDGSIEFLGRIDHQIKLRGFRIELGEIEAVLSQHPGVSESVVMAREDVPGDKRLVAYVVPNKTTDHRPQTTDLEKEEGLGSWVLGLGSFSSELRQYVKAKLPEYMVPTAFVVMDALPLTPNGKVDRRALPAPEASRRELAEEFVAPRTAVEEVLARIWAEVLRLERVGVQDNFFELGGDSILSIQIIARANEAGLRLTAQQMFQHQTIAELAAVAGTGPAIEAEQGVVVGEAPLVPIQQWFFEQELAEPHHFNQALLLQVRQAMDATLLAQAVQQLLVQHDALRLRFVRGESDWQQINADVDGTIPFVQIDVSGLADQRATIEVAAEQVQASLNLSDGPLLRVVYFEMGSGRASRLLIVIHHLAMDGVSWRILLEDLLRAYEQLSRGEAVELGRKTTSFKRWAERLSAYARSEGVKEEAGYWLSEARARVGRLPVDVAGGVNTMASARTVGLRLNEEETRTLLQEVPEAYHTQITEVLLTALVQAFAAWTGESKLLVDLEGHGREGLFEDIDVTRTVGWFTSVYPVLLDLESAADVGSALKTIKEQVRRVPKRGVGYGMLRYLSPDPELAERLRQMPSAEVSFNYLGQLDQALPENAPVALAPEFGGTMRSRRGQRRYLLDVHVSVIGNRLQVVCMYSDQVHRRETIERLAHSYLESLRAIIAHCQSPEGRGFTPSDFPLVDLNQQALDKIVRKVKISKAR
jgi:amino acid adenylation domain-containing protein/non-ribosomal peptide synthase protein (TIGR01720 family)